MSHDAPSSLMPTSHAKESLLRNEFTVCCAVCWTKVGLYTPDSTKTFLAYRGCSDSVWSPRPNTLGTVTDDLKDDVEDDAMIPRSTPLRIDSNLKFLRSRRFRLCQTDRRPIQLSQDPGHPEVQENIPMGETTVCERRLSLPISALSDRARPLFIISVLFLNRLNCCSTSVRQVLPTTLQTEFMTGWSYWSELD